jgi:ankyrin repeat protein
VIKELEKVGVDANVLNNYGNTPLITACKRYRGDMSEVEELVNIAADVNLQDKWGDTPLITAVREGSLALVKYLVDQGAESVTEISDTNVTALYTALILNKPDIVKYLVHELNKIRPGQFDGNSHHFNCLMYIRHTRVKTDSSRDDMAVTDRLVWCMDRWGDLWRIIRQGDCDALRRLLCLGLDVNQSIQLCVRGLDGSVSKSDNVKPLLYALVDEEQYNEHRIEKVRMLLEAGANVNVRVRCGENERMWGSHNVLDREGVSVLERMRQLMWKHWGYSHSVSEYQRGRYRITKHARRYSR